MFKGKLTDNEKLIIACFKEMRIPRIFKDYYIDYLLFLESVHFDLCTSLLKQKDDIKDLLLEYKNNSDIKVKQLNVEDLDEDAIYYYKVLLMVIDIAKKHC